MIINEISVSHWLNHWHILPTSAKSLRRKQWSLTKMNKLHFHFLQTIMARLDRFLYYKGKYAPYWYFWHCFSNVTSTWPQVVHEEPGWTWDMDISTSWRHTGRWSEKMSAKSNPRFELPTLRLTNSCHHEKLLLRVVESINRTCRRTGNLKIHKHRNDFCGSSWY